MKYDLFLKDHSIFFRYHGLSCKFFMLIGNSQTFIYAKAFILNQIIHTLCNSCSFNIFVSRLFTFFCQVIQIIRLTEVTSNAATILRASGLSILEIRHYFDLCQQGISSIQERTSILTELKDRSQRDLEKMQLRIDCLTDKIEQCRNVIDSNGKDDCNPLNW